MGLFSCGSLAIYGMCYWIVVLGFLSMPTDGRALVPAVYVFGDSLVDVGNNNHIVLSVLKANFPHNGVDYPGRKATGRFSNGKNAADFVAEKFGLPTSPPYLSLKSNDANAFLQGVSFASGGAGFFDTTNKGRCLTIDQQIQYYSNVYAKVVQQLGDAEARVHFSKCIFAIVAGSNDILAYLRSNNVPPQKFVSSLVSKFSEQFRRIYNLGARKFFVFGTPPVGCTPSQRRQNKTGECNAEANYLSKMFSYGVSSVLKGMVTEFGDMKYSFFDSEVAVLQYIERPADYGFVEVKAACCGLGNLNAKIACLPISTYCSNRNSHIFWDFFHPTEAFSQKIVDIAFGGSKPYIFPVNLRELAAL